MRQLFGISEVGDLKQAVSGFSKPDLLVIIDSDKERFSENVAELEEMYPGVPSIGCVGQSYGGMKVMENGLLVVSLSGDIQVAAGILTNIGNMPMKRIKQFENAMNSVGGNSENTVCIDFSSGNDECVIATMQSILKKKGISLTGGTAWEGLVSCNGKVYQDAATYAFVHNKAGKVRVYKENIYVPTDKVHMVTKAKPDDNIIYELDGKPVAQLYAQELGIPVSQIETQTFVNPLGRCIGEETYIVSIREVMDNGSLACYRKTNPKERLNILELGDYDSIVRQTVSRIQSDFSHISGVFSINCAFRYLFFERENYTKTYFGLMNQLGTHAGLVGLGEHYKTQHTNQTMSCVVFE